VDQRERTPCDVADDPLAERFVVAGEIELADARYGIDDAIRM
jgi:hypothetical protein